MGPQRMPRAEVDVSPQLVRRLLASQHPDLARLPVGLLANGWDNVMFRIGGDLIARLPRRALAAGLAENEHRWVPALAPLLPLPVPVPLRIGRPEAGYPWSWSIVPFLPGQPAALTPPEDLREAAAVLGRFLGALHQPAPADAPDNPLRGLPLTGRAANVGRDLETLGGLVDRAAVRRGWEEAVALPRWDGPRVWMHGDTHPANILVREGRISGVIDFGDVGAGDPATDLSVAWMLLPPGEYGTFRNAYRAAGGFGTDEVTWARARGWALALSLAILAHSADNPLIAGIGHRTLPAVLAEIA